MQICSGNLPKEITACLCSNFVISFTLKWVLRFWTVTATCVWMLLQGFLLKFLFKDLVKLMLLSPLYGRSDIFFFVTVSSSFSGIFIVSIGGVYKSSINLICAKNLPQYLFRIISFLNKNLL